MDFFATNRFNESVNKLIAKKKHYGCALSHIYKQFYNKTDSELFDDGYKLNGNHPIARQMKVRVLSCGGNAKSEGFRLIVFVHKDDEKYYLLDIYPKTGPFNKSNMKKDERKLCLEELLTEKKNNTLFTITFDNKKKTIVLKN
ncbi:MAG: hypothetical protein F9K09_04260 [Flavobacteriales bacterium]|nr:MAG: hypothetical protein F9K09_04260 [Flavobacteriales bacterium]